MDEAIEAGALFKCDTLDELADKMGFTGAAKDTFLATVERYNELYDKQNDEDFGKPAYRLSAIRTAPFYGCWLGASLLTTEQGIAINEKGQALDNDNKPMPGLYITGDIQKNDLTDSLSFYMNVKVSFKNKVKATNGKLSNKSKTVSWTIRDASKKKNFYASTSKVTKTAKTTAVKNNKSYKAGKKITVSNSKSLVKMKLDGKVVKKNTVVKKKGTHTLTIWSKNGKVQNVTFTIK